MGTWSSKPFGNDTALDWAFGLKDADGMTLIADTIRNTLEQKGELDAPIAEASIAAAAVIAAAAAEPVRSVSQDIGRWIRTQGYVPDKRLIGDAIKVLDRIMTGSELRDLWAEQDALESWVKATGAVRDKLTAAKKQALPVRKPRKPGMPRSFHKLLERYGDDPSDQVRAKIRKKVESMKDPDAATRDTNYREPLALLAEHGLLEEARLLLDKGANPSGGSAKIPGKTPFDAACCNGHIEIAEMLHKAGAEVFDEVDDDIDGIVREQMDVRGVEAKPVGYRYCLALFIVARRGTPATADYLVGLGADLSQSDLNGETLLHKAAEGGNVAMLEFLVAAGLDVNNKKGLHAESPLHYAVQSNKIESVKFLLENGADVNAIESFEGSEHRWYNTPLDFAESENTKPIIALLKKYGAKRAVEIVPAARALAEE